MEWLVKQKKTILIYTDGSCCKNVGGWAALILRNGKVQELSGAEHPTTNNRMEMMAALMALKSLEPGTHAFLVTDSKYLQHGILHWVSNWKLKDWKTYTGQDVQNKDLWMELDELNRQHVISWHWVKGHDGHEHNERCDRLAHAARTQLQASIP